MWGIIVMSNSCDYFEKYGKCYFGNKSKNANHAHIGTEEKLEFIGKYTRDWPYKTLSSSSFYDCIVFVDAMCSSGEYLNHQGNEIKGSTLRVLDSFVSASNNSKLKNKKSIYFLMIMISLQLIANYAESQKNTHLYQATSS